MTLNRQIANSYYNLGLENAKCRDLTGAAECLKHCLQYDKYHIDGRNLLGLIYNEIGEVASALTQWIISLNFQPEKNVAKEYLTKIYGNATYLEVADQVAKKYNQALTYAQNGNEDLAVLLLQRVMIDMPNYVKGQQLLALLYMRQEEYVKAGRCLYKALNVDALNSKSLRYMTITKEHTGRADVEKKKLKNAFSHQQMEDDDIVISPTYKENTGWQVIAHILVGLGIGVTMFFFLVLPSVEKDLNENHNDEMLTQLTLLNEKNIEIDKRTLDAEEAITAQAEIQAVLDTLVDDNDGVLIHYMRMIQILEAYLEEDLEQATLLYTELDSSVFVGTGVESTMKEIQEDMETSGYQTLISMAENSSDAILYYEKSLLIKPDNPEVYYKMGVVYQEQGNEDEANEYFGKVIKDYPSSEYASLAKEKRGY